MKKSRTTYTQREWDRTVGIGKVPEKYMSPDDPDGVFYTPECECHDIPIEKREENMSSLVSHIKSINENSKKEMDANPHLWVGIIVEDPKHWADYGITTPAQFDRYQDEQCLYEIVSMHTSKSYARSLGISSMTDEELYKTLDFYSKAYVTDGWPYVSCVHPKRDS